MDKTIIMPSGYHVIMVLQVTSNGFFSFGREAHLHNPVLFPESVFYNHLVAPYWVNSDIRQSGRISYEVHSTLTGLVSAVNNFIQQEDDEDFIGTWMMVATFNEVPLQDSTSNKVAVKIGSLTPLWACALEWNALPTPPQFYELLKVAELHPGVLLVSLLHRLFSDMKRH